MNTLSQKIKENREKLEKTTVPAIYGKITDSDECCNCGEDLAIELYDAFSEGYEMAIGDSQSHLHSSTIDILDTIEKWCEESKCPEN